MAAVPSPKELYRRQSFPTNDRYDNKLKKEVLHPLEGTLGHMKERIQKLEEQIQTLRANLALQQNSDAKTRKEIELETSQKNLSELKRQLSDAMILLNRTEDQLNQRDKELQETKRQVESLTEQRAGDSKTIKNLEDMVKNLKKQLKEREDDVTRLQKNLQETQTQVQKTSLELLAQKERLKKTEEQLTVTKGVLKTTNKAMTKTQDKMQQQELATAAIQASMNKMAEQLQALTHRQCTEDAPRSPDQHQTKRKQVRRKVVRPPQSDADSSDQQWETQVKSTTPALAPPRHLGGICNLPPLSTPRMNFPPQ